MKYDHKQVEKKWQDIWDEAHCFEAENGSDKEKFYALVEFPYPSGQGLHVGHPRSYTALDIVARKKRMQGYNVLYPMGWDAFGLPTENYAIKNHVHPAEVTKKNIARFKSQLKALGLSFDWSREINTTDPNYYKWTQWIFLQLFKHGLAYKKEMNVNWCTSCKCVLANEEVVNGVCERCGSEVVHKTKSQWMLAITKYADRLIDDLDDLDFIERVKIQQKNWIGRSEGTEVDFTATNGDKLTVYTTRCDTLFGVTYMVISPEHPYLQQWKDQIKNWDAVAAYIDEAAHKSDFERGELNKEKTGVRLEGIEAINPASGKQVPLFVSDYVLMGYGTGIVMGVPGHDQRDWEFATKFGLPIVEVVQGGDIRGLKYISFLNIRLAHQVPGCADGVLPFLWKRDRFCHTLIVSPPRLGKTTLLRDIIRQVSDGGEHPPQTVGVVDERSELGACSSGVPQNDLGRHTDVLDGCPKAAGILMLLRTMSPRIIAVDEVGSQEDLEALSYSLHCGCGILATVHGSSLEDLKKKPVLCHLVGEGIFERYLILSAEAEGRVAWKVMDESGRRLGEGYR